MRHLAVCKMQHRMFFPTLACIAGFGASKPWHKMRGACQIPKGYARRFRFHEIQLEDNEHQ